MSQTITHPPLAPGAAAKGRKLTLGIDRIDRRLGGGLEVGGFHEIRAAQARDIAAATAFVLSLIATLPPDARARRILWVCDPAALRDAGMPFSDGIAQYGLDPEGITLVHPLDVKTALWAAEEGARCPDLAAVILHLRGNPAMMNRVAARRLLMRARSCGTLVCLLRQSGAEEASAALTRWQVAPGPAPPDPDFRSGIGLPCLRLVLERCRAGTTGSWTVCWNLKTRAFDHVSDPCKQIPVAVPASPAHRPDPARTLGKVVDFGRPARSAARGGD